MPISATRSLRTVFKLLSLSLLTIFPANLLLAQAKADCASLPDQGRLKSVLQSVVKDGKQGNGGLGNQSWAVVVNRDGIVCAVVFSGPTRGDQWPGSRVIAAEKASTANALSLPNFALSTA